MSGTEYTRSSGQDIRDIEAAAARWVVRMRDRPVSDVTEKQFDAWLAQGVHHRECYMRCEVALAMADELSTHAGLSAELQACAQLAARDAASQGDHAGWRFTRPSRRWWGALAALALVAGSWLFAQWNEPERYQTGIGERRSVLLSDHSTLTLNTDTVLTVSLGKRVRRIELQRGEAFFEVAHDVARPFEVHAANGVARAVGTQFSVQVQNDTATVSVLQGVVVVAPRTETLVAGVPADAPRLEANKSIHYGAGGNLGLVQAADLRRISAWREGKLVFDDLPLADALAEYNRYTAHKVVVGSEQIGRRRVSGVLNIGDFESLSLLLHESLGLTLVEQGGSVLLLDPEVAAPAQTLPATASRS